MTIDEVKEQVLETLREEAAAAGVELRDGGRELAQYTAERASHLADVLTSGEPGYLDIVRVERNNVALRAGITASRSLDVAKQRFLGMLTGVLRTFASILATT